MTSHATRAIGRCGGGWLGRIKFAAMQAMAAETGASYPATDQQQFRLFAAGVLLLAGVLFFARLGARALWSSEFRWAEIAREMNLTGNYFWPTINGRLYYDKPLLSYWMVLGASHVTGSINEAAARMPCAIAGLLAVALLMMLARRLYNWRTAALSGFILATSFSFVFFSRHASADVDTITGELAALLLFMKYRDRPGGWWVVALWLVMAVTSLTKGLLGFALPILAIGTYSCLAEGWGELRNRMMTGTLRQRLFWLVGRSRWFFNWKSIPAMTLAGAVYALPFAVSSARMQSNAGFYLVYRENVVRFFHPFDHRGPIYLYAYVIFALMAPWSLLLPAALAQAHRGEAIAERTPADRFTLTYFWATFILFTLSGSRRSYYILPILPAGAMLVARLLSQRSEKMSAIARRLLKLGYFLLIAAVISGGILLIPQSMRPSSWSAYPPTSDAVVFAVFWLVSIASIVYAIRNPRPTSIVRSAAIIAYLSMTYLYVFAMPAADAYRAEKPFGLRIRQQLHGDMAGLAFFRTQGPLFYLDPPSPVPEYEDGELLRAAVHSNGIRWVIVRRRDAKLLGLSGTVVASEASFPWEGDRDARNKEILLRVGNSIN